MSKGGGGITGFRYKFGIHMGLCHGPVDALLKIEVGGKPAWPATSTEQVSGGPYSYVNDDGDFVQAYDPPIYADVPEDPPVTESASITINAPDLFGGEEAEGGIQGDLDVMMGEGTQPVNTRLATMLGGLVSAFRGMFTIFYDGLISCNNPYPKPWRFSVRRIRKGWDDDDCWYPGKAGIPFTCPAATEGGDPPEPKKRLAFIESFDDWPAPYTETGSNQSNVTATSQGAGVWFSVLNYAIVSYRQFVREVRDIDEPVIPARAEIIEFKYDVTPPEDPYALHGLGGAAAFISFTGADTAIPILFNPMPGYEWDLFADPPVLVPRQPYFSLPVIPPGGGSYITTGGTLGVAGEGYWSGTVRIVVGGTSATVSLLGYRTEDDGKVVEVLYPSTTIEGDFNGPPGIINMTLRGGNASLGERFPTKFSQVCIYEYSTAEAADGDGESMNPAHIIYECLTNKSWGRGLPAELIDTVSFAAAADTLYAEEFGLCLSWSQEDDILVFIQTVIDHIGAVLYASRETGLVTLVLIRDDYVVGELPVFTTQTGLLGISEDDATSSQELVNELVVSYVCPRDGSNKQVRVHNIGAMQASGAIFSKSVSYPGIPTHELAARVAQRDLRVYGTPLRRFKLTLDRRAWQMAPGKVFVIESTERSIGTLVLRAGEVTDGDASGSTILVTAVQDIFGLPATSFVGSVPPSPVPDRTPKPVLVQAMYEVGYIDALRTMTPAEFLAMTVDDTYVSLFGEGPSSFAINFTIFSGVSGGVQANHGYGNWSPHGTVATDVGFTDTSVELSSVYRGADIVLGDAARIDNEIVRVVSYDADTGMLGIFRGCADTLPALHAAGSRIWFIYVGGGYDTTRYAEGETVTAKLLTNTLSGNLPPGAATGLGAITVNRQARPYPPASMLVNGDPYISVPDVEVPITFEWRHRNRLMQADILVPYDQPSITPEEGTTYTVRVKSGDVVLRETTDIPTNSFVYELSDWQDDGEVANPVFEIVSVRDDFECWQPTVFELDVSSSPHLHTESSGSLLTETPEALLVEEAVAPPPPDPTPEVPGVTLQTMLSQAVLNRAMVEGDILYGVWWNSNSGFSDVHVLGRDTTDDSGTYLSPLLASGDLNELLYIGSGTFYAACSEIDEYGGLVDSYIHRLEVGVGTTTWTAPSGEQVQALGWDGTYLWSYGLMAGTLRKHNATTLAVLGTFNLPDLGGINFGGAGAWADGKMLVQSAGTVVTCCDPTLSAPFTVWTVNLGKPILGLFARGSLFFVAVYGGVRVLDADTGDIVASYTDGMYNGVTEVVGASTDFAYRTEFGVVRWLSAVDGSVVRERSLAGIDGYYQVALDSLVITAVYADIVNNSTWIYDI